jgi:hypothetical protein
MRSHFLKEQSDSPKFAEIDSFSKELVVYTRDQIGQICPCG